MALNLTYNTLAEQYKKNTQLTGTGEFVASTSVNVPQLEPINIPLADLTISSGVIATQRAVDTQLDDLGLKRGGQGKITNNSNESTFLVNSNRVIINSKLDYAMLFGQAGVVISSPNKVNIDSDSSITLFGMNNLYLGVPGKGSPRPNSDNPKKPQKKNKGKISKVSPTKDFDYEPLVLGLKLTNWLDDLIQILKNAILLTPVGKGYFREDTQYDLVCLQARLTEMLSTYAFVDGFSHEMVDVDSVPPPPNITQPPTNLTGTVEIDEISITGEQTAVDDLLSLPDYSNTTDTQITYK